MCSKRKVLEARQDYLDCVEGAALRCMSEILDDMHSGRVPRSVRDFAQLHDHVDANCYGGACADDWWADGPEDERAAVMQFWCDVQERVHQWLASGEHDAPRREYWDGDRLEHFCTWCKSCTDYCHCEQKYRSKAV